MANEITDPSLTNCLSNSMRGFRKRSGGSTNDHLSKEIEALIDEIENATKLPTPTTDETEELNTDDTTSEKPPSTSNNAGVTFGLPPGGRSRSMLFLRIGSRYSFLTDVGDGAIRTAHGACR